MVVEINCFLDDLDAKIGNGFSFPSKREGVVAMENFLGRQGNV